MSWPGAPDTLACRDCGRVLHRLTPEEVRLVAEAPQHYALRCADCARRHEDGGDR